MANKIQRGVADDLADVLLEQVREIARGAERTATASAHAVELAKELFEHRGEYAEALQTVRRIVAEDRHDLFLQNFSRAYRAATPRLGTIEHRSDLLLEMISVWLDALKAVENILAGRPVPFHWYLDEDDRAIMAEERAADADLGAQGIAEAWQA